MPGPSRTRQPKAQRPPPGPLNRAWWGHRIWQASCLPEVLAFHRGRLKSTQERILKERLAQQAPSAFGQRHNLRQIRSYEEFRERIPVSRYEDLLPYLQMARGLSTQAVKIWEPTGGSTGASKWVPWTAALQNEFRRAVSVWIWHLLVQYPETVRGRGYWQLTPKAELNPPDWIGHQRHGFERDSDYLGRLGRWLERSVLIVPPAGQHLWERTVDLLLDSCDLRLVSCWSPSFLTVLQEKVQERAGRWSPGEWWPHLKVLSCWTQGPSSAYLPKIRSLFPGVKIQPKGLLSTEAVVTIPIRDQFPLAYRSHFFEFQTGNRIIPPWELQPGHEATVVVTTGSGFTRYATGDRVRVSGFLRDLPCLEFLGRDGVSDQRGEKLPLAFLEGLLEPLDGFAMLAFEDDGYVLFVDESQSLDVRREQIQKIEMALLENFSYADCRHLGQLRALRGFLINGDALDQYRRVVSHSQKVEIATVKIQRFHPYGEWSRNLQGNFLPAP